MSSNKKARGIASSGWLGLAATLVLGTTVHAAVDLAALEVQPQRGQSGEQLRRDRYECHNWAVEQSGEVPLAMPAADENQSSAAEREQRAERIDRVLRGAAIGAGLGGLVRAAQRENPSNGVLAGAAVGAVIGAATGRSQERGAPDEAEPSDYLRALTACLEGRGYAVALPSSAEVTASR
jgi:hypothetical protein